MNCYKEIANEFVKGSRSLCESFPDFEKMDEKTKVVCQALVALILCNKFFDILDDVLKENK